jgi:hypothetical protein
MLPISLFKRTLCAAQAHFSHFNLVPNRCLLLPNSSFRLRGRILILSQSHNFFLKPWAVASCVSFWKTQKNILYCKIVKDSNRNSVNYRSGSVRKHQLISVTLGFLLFHTQGMRRQTKSLSTPATNHRVRIPSRARGERRYTLHNVGYLVINFGSIKPPAHPEDGDRVSSHT